MCIRDSSGTKSGPLPGVSDIALGLPEVRRKPYQGETLSTLPPKRRLSAAGLSCGDDASRRFDSVVGFEVGGVKHPLNRDLGGAGLPPSGGSVDPADVTVAGTRVDEVSDGEDRNGQVSRNKDAALGTRTSVTEAPSSPEHKLSLKHI